MQRDDSDSKKQPQVQDDLLPPENLNDPKAAEAVSGLQALVSQPFVQDAIAAGDANLARQQALIQAAYNGDEEAQKEIAKNSLGFAMGTMQKISQPSVGLIQRAEEALGRYSIPPQFNDKLAHAQNLMRELEAALEKGQISFDQYRAGAQKLNAQISRVQKYADGGEVEAPQLSPDLQSLVGSAPNAPSQEPLAPLAQESEIAPPPPMSNTINVLDPGGKLVSIAPEDLQGALNSGFREASDSDLAAHVSGEKYGSTGQQILSGLEGAADAATFGISSELERAAGVSGEDIRGRREENPGSRMLGQAAGLIGSSLYAPGGGAAGVMEAAGVAGLEALGLKAATTIPAKIGSAAVKGAIENMMFQAGDEQSKFWTQDPNQSAQSALVDVGLAGLLGGGVSGGLGAINPLWQATLGSKTAGILKQVADKAGGIEGHVPSVLDDAVAKAGIELPPEIRAKLSDDPVLQQMGKTLEQSDTTKSGLEYQASLRKVKADADEALVGSLGKTVKDLDTVSDLSKYESGKTVGDTLSKEYKAKIDPLSKEFEALKEKYQNADLFPNERIELPTNNPYGSSTVIETRTGTIGQIADKISELADKEGWSTDRSSDIMREVRRTLKELPAQKTVKNLSDFATSVGNNTSKDILNGPLVRAGAMIKGIIRDAESEVALQRLGTEAPELVERYKIARKAYQAQAQLKDALDDRLHIGGSTSGYAKRLSEMARTDGEKLLQRLSGVNDADALNLIQTNFPETAQKIRDYHIQNVLKTAVDRAKSGEAINAKAMIGAINKMSPELRAFTFTPESLGRVNAVATMLEKFEELPHNFSNTGRTVDKLLEYVPSSAVGMATMIAGHNPATALVLGALTKALGKDLPDAARLGILKFLGSNKPIEASGFKSMVDFINSSVKGENIISKATKDIFKAGKVVLPNSLIPSDSDRKKLDRRLEEVQKTPTALLDVGGKTAHYLPDHGSALSTVAQSAVNYLNTLRPSKAVSSPLDTPPKPSATQQAQYNRALDIAQQPLVVLNSIKEGTITPNDVKTLMTLYPALYAQLNQRLMAQVSEVVSKGQQIPYKTRIGLSLFSATPLDSTMTPGGIQSAQMTYNPSNQPQDQSQTSPAPGRTVAALSKLPSQYLSSNQARQQRASTK